MQQNPLNTTSGFYVPFDEWLYRNIIDICLDFTANYQDINTFRHETAVAKCENIFESLMDFARDCKELPIELREPDIVHWSFLDGMPSGVIHPRRALTYVMKLMNELKRQQTKTGRDPEELIRRYGLDKKREVPKEDSKTDPEDW